MEKTLDITRTDSPQPTSSAPAKNGRSNAAFDVSAKQNCYDRISVVLGYGNDTTQPFFGHVNAVTSIIVDPIQLNCLFTSSRDSTLKKWRLKGDHAYPLYTLEEHTHWINDAIMIPDSTHDILFTCSNDKTVKIWSVERDAYPFDETHEKNTNGTKQLSTCPPIYQSVETLNLHTDYVQCLGRTSSKPWVIASGGLDGYIYLIDAESFRVVSNVSLANDSPILNVNPPIVAAVSLPSRLDHLMPPLNIVPRNYQKFVGFESNSTLVEQLSLPASRRIVRDVNAAAYQQNKSEGTPSNKKEAGTQNTQLDFEDLPLSRINANFSVWCLSMNSTGNLIASGGNVEKGHYLNVWDTRRQRLTYSLKAHEDFVRRVYLSPDGTEAITCSSDTFVKHWDLRMRRCIYAYNSVDSDSVWNLYADFEKNSHIFFSSNKNGNVYAHSILRSHFTPPHSDLLAQNTDAVTSLSFDFNRSHLWIGCMDSCVYRYIEKGNHAHRLLPLPLKSLFLNPMPPSTQNFTLLPHVNDEWLKAKELKVSEGAVLADLQVPTEPTTLNETTVVLAIPTSNIVATPTPEDPPEGLPPIPVENALSTATPTMLSAKMKAKPSHMNNAAGTRLTPNDRSAAAAVPHTTEAAQATDHSPFSSKPLPQSPQSNINSSEAVKVASTPIETGYKIEHLASRSIHREHSEVIYPRHHKDNTAGGNDYQAAPMHSAVRMHSSFARFSEPLVMDFVLPGICKVCDCTVLKNQRKLVTRDLHGCVICWDIMKLQAEQNYTDDKALQYTDGISELYGGKQFATLLAGPQHNDKSKSHSINGSKTTPKQKEEKSTSASNVASPFVAASASTTSSEKESDALYRRVCDTLDPFVNVAPWFRVDWSLGVPRLSFDESSFNSEIIPPPDMSLQLLPVSKASSNLANDTSTLDGTSSLSEGLQLINLGDCFWLRAFQSWRKDNAHLVQPYSSRKPLLMVAGDYRHSAARIVFWNSRYVAGLPVVDEHFIPYTPPFVKFLSELNGTVSSACFPEWLSNSIIHRQYQAPKRSTISFKFKFNNFKLRDRKKRKNLSQVMSANGYIQIGRVIHKVVKALAEGQSGLENNAESKGITPNHSNLRFACRSVILENYLDLSTIQTLIWKKSAPIEFELLDIADNIGKDNE